MEEEEEASEEALLAALATPTKKSEPHIVGANSVGDPHEGERDRSPSATKGPPESLTLPSGVPVAAAGVGGTPDADDLRKRRLARFGQ